MRFIVGLVIYIFSCAVVADCCCDLQLPANWNTLKPILNARLRDPKPELKLTDAQVDALIDFLEAHQNTYAELQKLQLYMPNTTLELVRLLQSKAINDQTAQQQAADLLHSLKGKTDMQIVSLDAKTALQLASSRPPHKH